MAPGYGQYNNYYDPVGSQANQPQPYSYQTAASSASQPTTASYSAPSYPSYGSNSYSTQQHGTTTSGQDNQSSASRLNSVQQHDGGSGSWGNPNYTSSSYGASLQPPARSQNNTSSLYATSASSNSYGRLNYNTPSSQAQSSATTCGQPSYAQQSGAQSYAATTGTSDTSRQVYGASQHAQAPTEPSRYASPLQPVQTQAQNQQSLQQSHPQSHQQTHARQPSRSSIHQTSPVMTRAPPQQTSHRQASSSVEPSNTTVDPSQVYDLRAERERKANAEAEKRRKMEDVEAVKKAEEARVAEEQCKVDEAIRQAEETKRQAEEQRANEERRRAEQARRKVEEQAAVSKDAAKANEKRKKEEQRKARESKNAANTLAAMASSSNVPDLTELPPPLNDEEAEMRAMFQKMREFNSKNPAMLAKLWEEERRSHAVQSQSPQPSPAPQTTVNPPKSKPSAPQQSLPNTPISGTTSTPNQAKSLSKAVLGGTTLAGTANQGQGSEGNASQGTTHLWPPGKKGLLAEIAARWLQNVNPQQPVMISEVLKRLDMNPNYVQLCVSLEAMGLKFERTAFARELLRGIPPGSTSSQPLTKVSDATIMSANGTVAQAAGVTLLQDDTNSKPKRPRATKAEMEQRRALNLVKNMNKQGNGNQSSNGMVEYQMPSFTVPSDAANGGYHAHMPEQFQALASSFQPQHASPTFPTSGNHSQQPSQSVQPERQSISIAQQGRPMPVGSAQQTPEVKQRSPPRQPANKEEAARKRGFGDLVDLTADDSDDDAPPMKIMKPLQVQRPTEQQNQQPQQQQQQQQPYHYQPKPTKPESLMDNFTMQPTNAPPLKTPGIPTTAPLFMQPNVSFGLVPPPTQVNTSASGVSTPKLPPKRKGPSNEQLQQERVRGKMVVEPIMRDRVARRSTYDSRTIARDILLATGRHPDMRPLNSHMNVMQKLLGDRGGQQDLSGNKSDLATIKWDILDPEPPKKALPVKDPPKEPAPGVVPSTKIDDEDADDEEDGTVLAQKQRMQGTVDHVQSGARDRSALDLHNVSANNKPQPKRRGRPPRASLPNGNTDTAKNSPMNATLQGSSAHSGTPRQASGRPESTPASAPAGRTTASNAPSGTPVGYAAFRQLVANGNVIKKKGRPVGWRKDVHSREAQGLTPKKAQSSGTKTRTPASRPEPKLQEPKYQVYKCRWSDCDAQLHSLDVLKKHVLKVHGKSDEQNQYPCLWRGCADRSDAFEDIPIWLGHVDKEHLQPVAWQLGDGPRGGLSDHQDSELSEAYLSDSRGRSVTPIIRPMSNMGVLDSSSHSMPIGPGRPPAGSGRDERVAREELQKLKERKKAVGPTLEKTGVRLANQKRRMGFLDDENFEEVVESEGEGADD